ncbi:MAG: cation:proton antiporter [Rhodobacteraceae bacterium]|nr:cation:proton antiporter [Paracoccaceae bacterium]
MGDFLQISFVLLIAGVIAVPIASKFGLGSVLGYLIAGIVIGPILISLNVDVISLQHFAEFGVVMMLFLVGLELEPKKLWEMRTQLLGLGGLQIGVTTLLIMGIAMLFGLPWTISLAIGMVLALSSTAIILQTLQEKGLMKSDGGQASFSVLLSQDIAVIPMLAFIPLLAAPELMETFASEAAHGADAGHGDGHGGGHGDGHGDDHGDGHGASGPGFMDSLPAWAQALVTLGAIGFVIVGGSYLTRPIFRFIAVAKLRELFVATALMMVIGIALLMTLVGLSPALGTFLAGVVLANSEYRHELESDIDPFKGLLLGLFFMTVGASIDFGLLFSSIGPVVAMTLGLMALKAAVVYALAVMFKVEGADRWLFSLGLAQAGEFGFVLLSFTVANDVIPPSISSQLLLVVALSMLLTPLCFILWERVIAPKYDSDQAEEADEIDDEAPIIIAGLGRFGGIVNRMLRMAGHHTVVLDHNSRQLDMVRTFGFHAFFGDATRPDLLHAAGIENAKMLVVAIDDKDQATELVHYVHHNHPHVYIVARAMDRNHVYELYAAGCRDIIRETFDSSVRAGRSALVALGMHPFDAQKYAQDYEVADRRALAALAEVYDPDLPIHENTSYVERAKELIAEQEAQLRGDSGRFTSRAERGWMPPTLKDVAAEAEDGAE